MIALIKKREQLIKSSSPLSYFYSASLLLRFFSLAFRFARRCSRLSASAYGIFIVKKVMDDVKYEYSDGHNILVMTKHC
ncbi:MAG: hypothetical protein IJL63_05595 [Clostridia bacterium]|nr:hypothetical protein [Clostridia bacterium]